MRQKILDSQADLFGQVQQETRVTQVFFFGRIGQVSDFNQDGWHGGALEHRQLGTFYSALQRRQVFQSFIDLAGQSPAPGNVAGLHMFPQYRPVGFLSGA